MKIESLYNSIRIELFHRLVNLGTGHPLSKLYKEQVGLSFVLKGLSVFVSLLYVPVVLDFLNAERYGIWITLTTVVNWIRVMDIGLGGGLRNKLAESLTKNQFQQGNFFVSTTYGILGSVFLIVLIIFLIINPYLNWQNILKTELLSSKELLKITNIAVSLIIIAFILQPVSLIYDAYGKTSVGGFIQFFISFLTLILVWVAKKFSNSGNLELMAWIATGVPVIIYLIVSFYTFFIKYPWIRPSWNKIKINESIGMLKLSVQFFIIKITALVLYASIPFIVTQLFGPNEVAVYNVTNSLFNLPIMIIGLLVLPVQPLVTIAYSKGDITWIAAILRRLKSVSLLIVSGVIIMTFFSKWIFKIWIGNRLLIPFDLTVAIALFTIITVLNCPYSIFVNGLGKVGTLVKLSPVFIAVFIGLSIVLTKLSGNLISVSIALSFASLIGLIVNFFTVRNALKEVINN